MLQFVFTNIFLLSIGVLLYLSVRTLPRLDEEAPAERKRHWLERWIASEIPHRLDEAVSLYLGKLLRKTKVWLLRFDNILTRHLAKLSHEQQAGDKKIDFKEIVGEKGEGKEENQTQ